MQKNEYNEQFCILNTILSETKLSVIFLSKSQLGGKRCRKKKQMKKHILKNENTKSMGKNLLLPLLRAGAFGQFKLWSLWDKPPEYKAPPQI